MYTFYSQSMYTSYSQSKYKECATSESTWVLAYKIIYSSLDVKHIYKDYIKNENNMRSHMS